MTDDDRQLNCWVINASGGILSEIAVRFVLPRLNKKEKLHILPLNAAGGLKSSDTYRSF